MESSNTLCQCWSINRQRKLSHYRTRNHLWKLSHGWWIESTANTNSRLTNEINRENRVIVDAWNRQGKLRHYRQEIVNENWVTVKREIIFENWVKGDGWNRQRILIHGWRMKSIEKTESSLMHGIVSENCVTTDKKSSTKTELLLTLKSPLKYEWHLTYGVDSVKEYTSDA
jgi:hypothetical protein